MLLTEDRIIAKAVSTQHPELWNRHVSACEREKLVQVIQGQHEQAQLVDNGWADLWCHECGETDPVRGTAEEAAAKYLADGWRIIDASRFQAECPTCQVKPDTSTWSSQYQDNSGILG